jgi:hypothetical protein
MTRPNSSDDYLKEVRELTMSLVCRFSADNTDEAVASAAMATLLGNMTACAASSKEDLDIGLNLLCKVIQETAKGSFLIKETNSCQ